MTYVNLIQYDDYTIGCLPDCPISKKIISSVQRT